MNGRTRKVVCQRVDELGSVEARPAANQVTCCKANIRSVCYVITFLDMRVRRGPLEPRLKATFYKTTQRASLQLYAITVGAAEMRSVKGTDRRSRCQSFVAGSCR